MLDYKSLAILFALVILATFDKCSESATPDKKFQQRMRQLEQEHDRKTKKLREFEKWFRDNGGVAPNITFSVRLADRAKNQQLNAERLSSIGAPFARYEPRAFATKELNVDDLLFRVPNHIIIQTALKTEDPELNETYAGLKSDEDLLTLMLIRELALDHHSLWKPYLDLLPSTLNLPMFFKESELQGLQNPRAEAYAKKSKHYLIRLYEKVHEPLRILLSDSRIKRARANALGSVKAFVWAAAIVEMRAISIRGVRYLVPGPDMLWHSPRIERPREKAAGNHFLRHHRLISDDVETHSGKILHVDVTADRHFAVAEPLVEDFGDIRNELFLHHHGFVPDRNDFDCEIVKIPQSHKDQSSSVGKTRVLLNIIFGLFGSPEFVCLGIDRPLPWHAAQVTAIEYMPLAEAKVCLSSVVSSLEKVSKLVQEAKRNLSDEETTIQTFISWMKKNKANLSVEFQHNVSDLIEQEREFCFYDLRRSGQGLPLIEKSSGLIFLPRAYEDFARNVKTLLEECPTTVVEDEMLLRTYDQCYNRLEDTDEILQMCVHLTERERLAILFRAERKRMLHRVHQHLLDLASAADAGPVSGFSFVPKPTEIRGMLYRFTNSLQHVLDEQLLGTQFATDCRLRVQQHEFEKGPLYRVCDSLSHQMAVHEDSLITTYNLQALRSILVENNILSLLVRDSYRSMHAQNPLETLQLVHPSASGALLPFVGLVLELLPRKCSHHSWMQFAEDFIRETANVSEYKSSLILQLSLISIEVHWSYCTDTIPSDEQFNEEPSCKQRRDASKFQELYQKIKYLVEGSGPSRLRHRISWDLVKFAWKYVLDNTWWIQGYGVLLPQTFTSNNSTLQYTKQNSTFVLRDRQDAKKKDDCTWVELRLCGVSAERTSAIHRLWQHGQGMLTHSECIPSLLPNQQLFSTLQFVGVAAELRSYTARLRCLLQLLEKVRGTSSYRTNLGELIRSLSSLLSQSMQMSSSIEEHGYISTRVSGSYSGMLCWPSPDTLGCPAVNITRPDNFTLVKQLQCGTCVFCKDENTSISTFAV